MEFNVKLNATSIPYLDRKVIESFASLHFYSIENEIVSINPLMLAALNSNVISTMDDSKEYTVRTEFTVKELQALNDFIYTGSCNLNDASEVFHSLGINLNLFSQKVNEVLIKKEKKEEVVEIKEEFFDDYKENFSEEETEEQEQPILPSKPPKKTKTSPKVKRSIKKKNENGDRPKKKYNKSTQSKKEELKELPADFKLPKPLETYIRCAKKPYSENESGNPLYCSTCRMKFSTDFQLRTHNFRNHEDRYKCPFCHKSYTIKDEHTFKLHVYNHQALADTCIQCGKVFPAFGEIDRHLRVSGPYHDDQCAQCPQKFTSHKDYRAHVKFDHPTWMYKCGFCKEVFKKTNELKFHVSVIHKGTRKKTSLKDKSAKEVCELCGNSYTQLKSHILQVHEKVDHQLPCPHCDVKLRNTTSLKRHIEWYHVKDPCPDCGKIIARANMRRHKAVWHDAERKFKCDVCGKSFITNQNLSDHRNIHTGEKPYKCKYCTACFASSGTHAAHQRSHLGIKRASK